MASLAAGSVSNSRVISSGRAPPFFWPICWLGWQTCEALEFFGVGLLVRLPKIHWFFVRCSMGFNDDLPMDRNLWAMELQLWEFSEPWKQLKNPMAPKDCSAKPPLAKKNINRPPPAPRMVTWWWGLAPTGWTRVESLRIQSGGGSWWRVLGLEDSWANTQVDNHRIFFPKDHQAGVDIPGNWTGVELNDDLSLMGMAPSDTELPKIILSWVIFWANATVPPKVSQSIERDDSAWLNPSRPISLCVVPRLGHGVVKHWPVSVGGQPIILVHPLWPL